MELSDSNDVAFPENVAFSSYCNQLESFISQQSDQDEPEDFVEGKIKLLMPCMPTAPPYIHRIFSQMCGSGKEGRKTMVRLPTTAIPGYELIFWLFFIHYFC